MSNFSKLTFNPETKEMEMADWIDDYFENHQYGVTFDHIFFYKPENIKQAQEEYEEQNR